MRLAKVLVVDDDPGILEAVADGLRNDGFEVVAASRAYEAIKSLDVGGGPDVILVDLLMPDVSGESLLLRLRAHPKAQGVPIIATSASPDRLQAIAGQVDALLAKPFDFDALCDFIGQLCARRAAGGLLFGGLQIDDEHELQGVLSAELVEALRPGREAAAAANVLRDLLDFTKSHFGSEETLMQQQSYPDGARHAQEHSTWVAEAEALRASDASGLTLSAGVAIKDSVETHLRTRDAEFARYLGRS